MVTLHTAITKSNAPTHISTRLADFSNSDS